LAGKPKLRLAELDRLVREQIADRDLLPMEASPDPHFGMLTTGIGTGPGAVEAITEYIVVYRRRVLGYPVSGLPNSCAVTVSPRGTILKVTASWIELVPVGSYPILQMREGFLALKKGQGEQIPPPFSDGTAQFAGLFYHPARGFDLHPCYRFNVKSSEGAEAGFLIPAIRPEYYENGVSAVKTNETGDSLDKDELCARVKDMLSELEEECGILLEPHLATSTTQSQEIMERIYVHAPRLAQRICANLAAETKGIYASRTRQLAERLLTAIAPENRLPRETSALQCARAHVAEQLLRFLREHGTAEDAAGAQEALRRYATRIEWAMTYIFGAP
jgi:hypothetical protein